MQQTPAHLLHLARGRLPHHAGAAARIAEGFDQGLGARLAALAQAERAAKPVEDGGAERQALDALRGPVGGNVVAAHAPHFLGVGLEEDAEEPLAELVAHPLMEGARLLDRKGLGPGEGRHAERAFDEAEISQRLEGLQRIGVELAAIIDARQARPLEEIVGQDLVPEIDDFLRLREEAMAADIEEKSLVVRRAGDAADIDRVLLQNERRRGHAWRAYSPRSDPPDRPR